MCWSVTGPRPSTPLRPSRARVEGRYSCTIVNVGLETASGGSPSPAASPRTNAVLPAPSVPSSSTTSPGGAAARARVPPLVLGLRRGLDDRHRRAASLGRTSSSVAAPSCASTSRRPWRPGRAPRRRDRRRGREGKRPAPRRPRDRGAAPARPRSRPSARRRCPPSPCRDSPSRGSTPATPRRRHQECGAPWARPCAFQPAASRCDTADAVPLHCLDRQSRPTAPSPPGAA